MSVACCWLAGYLWVRLTKPLVSGSFHSDRQADLSGYHALDALYAQFFLDHAEALAHAAHGHGHSHSHTDLGPNVNAAWLAAASILIKEWLYQASKFTSHHSLEFKH